MADEFMVSYVCEVARLGPRYRAIIIAQQGNFSNIFGDLFELQGDNCFGSVGGLVAKVNEVLADLDPNATGAEVRAAFSNDPHYRVRETNKEGNTRPSLDHGLSGSKLSLTGKTGPFTISDRITSYKGPLDSLTYEDLLLEIKSLNNKS